MQFASRLGGFVLPVAFQLGYYFSLPSEAGFALWDIQVRETDIAGARVTATRLAQDFPDNPDLRKFLDAQPASLFRLTGK